MTQKSNEELARWAALFKAVNMIGIECDKRNVDFNKVVLSPNHIKPYIDALYYDYQKSLDDEDEQNRKKSYILNETIQRKPVKQTVKKIK